MVLGLKPKNPSQLEFQIQSGGTTTDDLGNRIPNLSSSTLDVQIAPDRRPTYEVDPGANRRQEPLICRVLGDGVIPDQILKMREPVARLTYQQRPGDFTVKQFLTSDIGAHKVSGSRIFGVFVAD